MGALESAVVSFSARQVLPLKRGALVHQVTAEIRVLVAWPLVRLLIVFCPCYTIIAYDVAPLVQGSSALSGGMPTVTLAQTPAVVGVGWLSFGPLVMMLLGSVTTATYIQTGVASGAQLLGASRARAGAGRLGALWATVCIASTVNAVAVLIAGWGISSLGGKGGHVAWVPMLEVTGAIALASSVYASLGALLGGLARTVPGAVVLCLAWTEFVEGALAVMGGGRAPGIFGPLYDWLPIGSASTLAYAFGIPGGGGFDQPLAVGVAVERLSFYAIGVIVAVIGVELWLGRRKALLGWPARSRRRPALDLMARLGTVASGRRSWRMASRCLPWRAWAHLRWRLMVALVIAPGVYAIVLDYAVPLMLGTGSPEGTAVAEGILPSQVAAAFLNLTGVGLLASAACSCIGTMAAASALEHRSLVAAVSFGRRRPRAVLGHGVTAVVLAMFASLFEFVVMIVCSMVAAVMTSQSVGGLSVGTCLQALGIGLLISASLAAVGFLVGMLFRPWGVALAVILVWVIVVQPTIVTVLPTFGIAASAVAALVPGWAAAVLAFSLGSGGFVQYMSPLGNVAAPSQLVAVGGLFVLSGASLVASALWCRKRDLL
ncbi:MAG TPA: hypothetical protein VFN61_14700 [Acidimicrobiales bacterium]|nr:hypothetical protein [Acidimicrobiales bacterium]